MKLHGPSIVRRRGILNVIYSALLSSHWISSLGLLPDLIVLHQLTVWGPLSNISMARALATREPVRLPSSAGIGRCLAATARRWVGK